ncbi:YoaK family protein [Rhizobium sp.]
MHRPQRAQQSSYRRLFTKLAVHRRTDVTDAALGTLLAFIAGAINAGGFIAIGKYTSHMTGIVSAVADDIALGALGAAGIGLMLFVAFTAGAGCSAILINWGRRNFRQRQYVYPLFAEALLLIGFGAAGLLQPGTFVAVAAPLLCFIMGLQNATITKISGARVRTTHVTGMVTDIGIELGKLAYVSRGRAGGHHPVVANLGRLSIHGRMVAMFFVGGIIGAVGFGHLGFGFSAPLAALLIAVVLPVILSRRSATTI